MEITPDLEPLLEAEAAKTGSNPVSVAEDLLRKSLTDVAPPSAPRLSAKESQLLEEINQGPPAEEMDRYVALIRKRQEGTVSEVELSELRAFTQRMEKLAVARMEKLAALARLRGIDIEELMEELQIQPPDVL